MDVPLPLDDEAAPEADPEADPPFVRLLVMVGVGVTWSQGVLRYPTLVLIHDRLRQVRARRFFLFPGAPRIGTEG